VLCHQHRAPDRLNPQRAVRRVTVRRESIDVQVDVSTDQQEPWQSWSVTLRCLILRLAEAAPSALLVWQAYVRH